MRFPFGLILLCLFVISCNPKTGGKVSESTSPSPRDSTNLDQAGPFEEIVPPPYIVAVLKKTGCYGSCPVFEAQIFSNGRMTYFGEQGVDKIGPFEAHHGQKWVEEIKARAKAIDYFGFDEVYPQNEKILEDFPLTITYLNFEDREKTIINNYDGPRQLRYFEGFLEKVLDRQDWRPIFQPN